MRFALAVLTLTSLLGVVTQARAQTSDTRWDGDFKAKATKRSDFVIGLSGGLAFGTTQGYPNEIEKLDEPAFEQSVKGGFGSSSRLWLGVALKDYFTFGLGGAGLSLKRDDTTASGGAFILHVEGYPLFGQNELLDDLAVFSDFGAGGIRIETSGSSKAAADGGFMSLVGLGVAYEHWRLWRFAFGPAVEFVHMWSPSLTFSSGLVEFRATFYGGPS